MIHPSHPKIWFIVSYYVCDILLFHKAFDAAHLSTCSRKQKLQYIHKHCLLWFCIIFNVVGVLVIQVTLRGIHLFPFLFSLHQKLKIGLVLMQNINLRDLMWRPQTKPVISHLQLCQMWGGLICQVSKRCQAQLLLIYGL